jgi:hypothetical protein
MPIEDPSNLVQQVLPDLAYIDELKTSRTGIGNGTMSIDPDDLQNVTKDAQLAAMSAAALKVEMLASLLAEGVKDFFRKIDAELQRHQGKPMDFEISGQWQQVDPSSWRRRTKVSVNVGLGSGNCEEMRGEFNCWVRCRATSTIWFEHRSGQYPTLAARRKGSDKVRIRSWRSGQHHRAVLVKATRNHSRYQDQAIDRGCRPFDQRLHGLGGRYGIALTVCQRL